MLVAALYRVCCWRPQGRPGSCSGNGVVANHLLGCESRPRLSHRGAGGQAGAEERGGWVGKPPSPREQGRRPPGRWRMKPELHPFEGVSPVRARACRSQYHPLLRSGCQSGTRAGLSATAPPQRLQLRQSGERWPVFDKPGPPRREDVSPVHTWAWSTHVPPRPKPAVIQYGLRGHRGL